MKYLKIFVWLCVIELFLQTVSYGRYIYLSNTVITKNKLLTNWYFNDPANAWWRQESLMLIPQYHPFVATIFQNVHTPHISIDSQGMRYTANNPTPEGGLYKKLFLFGGSTVFGYGVKNEDTIASFLAKKLNTPNAQFEVSNYGEIGYNSNQALMYLLLQLKNGNIPDIVIFYDGWNDIRTAISSTKENLNNIPEEQDIRAQVNLVSLEYFFRMQIHNTTLFDRQLLGTIVNTIVYRIKLIHYPIQLIQKISQFLRPLPTINQNNDSDISVNIDRMAQNYRKNAAVIEALSHEYHFQYYLLWEPLAFEKPLTQQEQYDTEISGLQGMKTIIDTSSDAVSNPPIPHFYNLGTLFASYPNTSLFMDICHVNAQGNSIAADKFANIIMSSQ